MRNVGNDFLRRPERFPLKSASRVVSPVIVRAPGRLEARDVSPAAHRISELCHDDGDRTCRLFGRQCSLACQT